MYVITTRTWSAHQSFCDNYCCIVIDDAGREYRAVLDMSAGSARHWGLYLSSNDHERVDPAAWRWDNDWHGTILHCILHHEKMNDRFVTPSPYAPAMGA